MYLGIIIIGLKIDSLLQNLKYVQREEQGSKYRALGDSIIDLCMTSWFIIAMYKLSTVREIRPKPGRHLHDLYGVAYDC